ncbi:MAG: lyase domain protein repeat-containing protein [Clostridia bacterium]|jgi:HEAT repeat protein|nr:lyase domain protein repeat-containing protein [Clostridia bacterium]
MLVYYSIIVFGIIIFSLYLYIIYVKTLERYTSKRKERYKNTLIPLVDVIVTELKNVGEMNFYIKDALMRHTSKNKLKSKVVEDRIIYYLETFKGDFISQLVAFCEESGIIDRKIKELSESASYIKALACKRLGELRSKKAVPYLLKEVASPSQDVTYNALLALAKIGDAEAFLKAFASINASTHLSERSLIEVADSFEGNKADIYYPMIDYENEFVSCIFIKSAGGYKDSVLGEKIAKFLSCDSKERILSAIKALAGMGDNRYIHQISELTTHEVWEIRAIAAKALGTFHDLSVINKLIDALSDRQWFVRYNAASSLLTLDKQLKYIAKVFEGEDRFAKDILISAMENSNILSLILGDTGTPSDFSETTVLLIKGYIQQGGGYKDE